MNPIRKRALWALTLATATAGAGGHPPHEGSQDWSARLAGKALYLKGFWLSDRLGFDSQGQPLEPSPVGPFTLSGIDVEHATLKGHLLAIDGIRVALVPKADGAPGLERQQISSTTHIAFSLRRGDKSNFHAIEHIEITIQPDSQGSYDRALASIFASSLAELAGSLPLYWECYARSYLLPEHIREDAEQEVEKCVVLPGDGTDDDLRFNHDGLTVPPSPLTTAAAVIPGRARDLNLDGTGVIHVRVGVDGVPVGLQVVRALGGGVDEAFLPAASKFRFKPATRAGVAVPMNLGLSFRIR